MSKDDCVFCREISGSRDTNFAARYPEIKSRILYSTESLLSFPCIGQLTKGHFLIVPRVHYNTFKDVHVSLTSLKSELSKHLEEMHKKLGINLNDSLFFEHGAINSSSGGCGIYHAHIHVVPNASMVHPNDIFNFEHIKPQPTIESALVNLATKSSYVMVGNKQLGFYARATHEPLPSQTLRKNVARFLNLDKWNWRETLREDSLDSLLAEISG